MSLKSKIAIILCSVFLLNAVVQVITHRFIIFPSFISLEEKEAIKDIKRVKEAIKREIHHLNQFCWDWASWDDTYDFVESRSPAYLKANLINSTFFDNEINLIYICNNTGKVIWGKVFDLETEEEISLSVFPPDNLSKSHPILIQQDIEDPLSTVLNGVFMTEAGAMMISSRPVLDSQNNGPSNGCMIMGRFLTQGSVNTLIEQTSVEFKTFSYKEFDAQQKKISEALTEQSPYHIDPFSSSLLKVYAQFKAKSNASALLICAEIPRKITQKGKETNIYALGFTLSAGVMALVVMILLLQKAIISPISSLTRHVLSIGRAGDLSKPVEMNRSDEIGTLAHEFNKMLEQLDDTKNRLLEQSYYSGMADMVSGVLHNLRNSLSPVFGNIEIAKSDYKKLPIEQVKETQRELGQEDLTEQRRTDLTRFLILASQKIMNHYRDCIDKLTNTSETARSWGSSVC